VGKEITARFIHENSNRSSGGQFLTLNCAAIPDNLVESELFGYEKGVFTGATKNKPGLFKMADGGTLFLDEICEMSLEMQNKLLRVLEYGEFHALGSVEKKKSSFILICATNADLKKMVRNNRFRVDLFHRINVITINIPALRERTDEIPELIHYFLDQLGYGNYELSLEAMDILLNYYWPGNIHELRNVIESAIAMMEDHEKIIGVEHLPMDKLNIKNFP
jgi:transcriptional regulator with PAS, ATPase and Fis domain